MKRPLGLQLFFVARFATCRLFSYDLNVYILQTMEQLTVGIQNWNGIICWNAVRAFVIFIFLPHLFSKRASPETRTVIMIIFKPSTA